MMEGGAQKPTSGAAPSPPSPSPESATSSSSPAGILAELPQAESRGIRVSARSTRSTAPARGRRGWILTVVSVVLAPSSMSSATSHPVVFGRNDDHDNEQCGSGQYDG